MQRIRQLLADIGVATVGLDDAEANLLALQMYRELALSLGHILSGRHRK